MVTPKNNVAKALKDVLIVPYKPPIQLPALSTHSTNYQLTNNLFINLV